MFNKVSYNFSTIALKISNNQKDVVKNSNTVTSIKYKKIKHIWYEYDFLNKNDILRINYFKKNNFLIYVNLYQNKKNNFLKTFIHYEFMEFYHYLNEYFSLNIFETKSILNIVKDLSFTNLVSVYLQTLLLPLTTFFNLKICTKKKNNIFLTFDYTDKNIFDFLDVLSLSSFLDKEESKLKILNYFCHYLADNLPFFWFIDKNSYLKDVCFFSTGTYFNSIGKNQKITNTDKKKFFGSFLRNETTDIVMDKFWYKPIIIFLRQNLLNNKTYFNNTNIINNIFILIYKSFYKEILQISNVTIGIYNLYFFFFKNQFFFEKLNSNNYLFKSLLIFIKKYNFLFLEKNSKKNITLFNYYYFNFLFKEYYLLFFMYSLKKNSLEFLPSILPKLQSNNLIPKNNSINFKNFFDYLTNEYGYNPVLFDLNNNAKELTKTIIKTKSFYDKNILSSTFQNYNLKGIEINRFKFFFKNYFVSGAIENWIFKFENLFKLLKIKFFTSHFSYHLPKKKNNTFDSIISFYKWKIFIKKKMPYFFDGPWMSVSKNKIGRNLIVYIVNNISDYWFIKNKNYLNHLHFSLFGHGFPSKKKINIKMLRNFYANYIYTLSKYNLINSNVLNPYVLLLNKFYLSPSVPFYLVNTEDNFGRFFEEYYYGYNKQLFYVLTSLIRQEFGISNSFLLKVLRMYSDEIKHQNKNFFSDDEDLTWDLNFSSNNSLYSGRSATNGLHIFINFLYEDFFRNLVNLDSSSVPIQEKCKSDSLFFHTFNWDVIEPLD